MNIVTKLSLASALALSIASPALAQNAQQGDYYNPTTGTRVSMHRMAALKTCTDGIKFDSDRYVNCMTREGENP
jgi:hypothetical protein